jgi:predicted enzyme related to lactoylglutathione lyase
MSLDCTAAFLTLAATDFKRLVEFYLRLLGQEPKVYLGDIYAEFELSGLRLAIFRAKASHQGEFANSRGSGMSLCLEVVNLEKVIADLTVMGYPPPGEIQVASHGREIYAYDPESNRIILHETILSET